MTRERDDQFGRPVALGQRRFLSSVARMMALVLLASGLMSLPRVHAAGLVVDAPNSAIVADGSCSLAEAIQNANDDAPTNADCIGGAGVDTITLAVPVAVDGTVLFPALAGPGYIDFGPSGLPEITSDITITGNTITRTGAGDYRFMVVRSGGHLTLDDVTLSDGRVAGHCSVIGVGDYSGCGGALVSQGGDITLVDATLSNNQAVETIATDITWGGAIAEIGGSITATTSIFDGNGAEYGGAIATVVATMSLTDTGFTNNTAVSSGGAIHNGILGELTIAGGTFSGNQVTTSTFNFLGGGAINNAGSSSKLFAINTEFDGNTAPYGGAIVNFNASDATLVNTSLTGNDASQGGAILNRGSGATLNLIASSVTGNTAGFSGGGGISNGGSSDTGIVNVQDSLITGNTSSGNGGGLTTLGTLVIENSAIDGNTATSRGGGIFVGSLTNQTVSIAGGSVSGNFAGSNGGGLYYTVNPSGVFANSLDVTDTVFDGNEADQGGGIYGDFVDVEISGSTFSNNTATNIGLGGGGGIYVQSFIIGGAHLGLTNSTVFGNTATQDGGGIYLNGSSQTADLQSVTIAGNTANSAAGADGLHSLAVVAAVVVKDTIIANNSNRNCLDSGPFGVTDGGNNISSDTTCDFADTGGAGIGDGVDPLLDSLADNGGNTQTQALLANSPAIDNGSVSCPAADQRGAGRVAGCDIGAYEAPSSTANLSIEVDTDVIYEAGETVATISVTLDNDVPDARDVEVIVPLRVTGTASGVGYDYILSNQAPLGAANAGAVDAIVLAVPAGNSSTQTFTLQAVDDALAEAEETVEIEAGVVGNAAFDGSNAVTVTIVSNDETVILPVLIDIKPGSANNTINIKSKGVLPVAILSSNGFDATNVDPFTVTLAGAGVRIKPNGKPLVILKDVNKDGLVDMLVKVETSDLNLTHQDLTATLEGKTTGGQLITGSDSVRIVRKG